MEFPTTRMRRLRKNAKIRDIVRETKLLKEDLIYPIYFKEELEGDEKKKSHHFLVNSDTPLTVVLNLQKNWNQKD